MNMLQFPCMQDSAGGKVSCPDANCALTGTILKSGDFAYKKWPKYFRKRNFNAKTLSECKREKCETFCDLNMTPK